MNAAVLLGALGAMGILGGRYLMLRALKDEAPDVFFMQLGAPSFNQLWTRAFDSASKKHLQSRFNSFIWSGEFLRIASRSIKLWGITVVVSDIATVAAVCVLMYQRFNDG